MDLKFSIVCFSLVLIQGSAEGCVDLVRDFLIFRDGLMEYFGMCDQTEESLHEVEDFLGFPITSDEHWRDMLCAIENVVDLAGLQEVLNEYIVEPLDEHTITVILYQLQGSQESVFLTISDMVKYQRKLQPWLAKTNFPHSWPVQNTGKKETTRMLAKGGDHNLNVLTYDIYDPNPNYKKWAKALLRADSLDEYLAALNEDLIGDTRQVECYTALQNFFRDSDRFAIVPEAGYSFLRVLDGLRDAGLFDILPEYPPYYNYYN